MRYYHLDGTYTDYPLDSQFGWFFEDITIDEASPTYAENNENIKEISRLQRSLSGRRSRTCDTSIPSRVESKTTDEEVSDEVEESVDVLEDMEYFASSSNLSKTIEESIDIFECKPEPTAIHKIETIIKEETPINSITHQQSVEGFIEHSDPNFLKQVLNYNIPSKEDMIALINPVNPESKALLSVISYSKYRRLNDKETNDHVLQTINFKATNAKRLINEKDTTSPIKNRNANFLLNKDRLPDINFLLNDSEIDEDDQLASEIQNYHATKEDNMLSLMMELIITDMDSNLGDMSELNNSVNEDNNVGTGGTDTSDLGNSIHSSILSKEGNGFREKGEKRNYLDIPNRSDILSSIGLSDDIDKSIESFIHEKSEMHQQLSDIRKSFEDDEKKIDALMDQASALQQDLRETTYLNNLIHLLNGHPEKVKTRRLPFRIFHQSIGDEEADANLII